LKKQTKYDFFYNSELVKSKGRVSVRARNLDLRVGVGTGIDAGRAGICYSAGFDLRFVRDGYSRRWTKIEMITVSGKVTDKGW